jgi:peptidoglycan/xylan/chitin deacetylase (PgdA/CDA1 family)
LILLILSVSKSFGENINIKEGIIALMYHRFDENKYPSTNIKNEIFVKQLNEIKKSGIEFISFNKFEKIVENNIDKKYVLLTIDDAFESFYLNAWPILNSKKIPFILFVNTREIGNNGYMNWENIKEISLNDFVTIGNHSHSHEYLVDWENEKIISDIEQSIKIFKSKLGYSPSVFSYPFGEYSNNFKKIIEDFNFKFAFGQHSGVIDSSKNFFELPRFPINEKYGELERFKSIIQTLPFPYKSITPSNRYIKGDENPPKVEIQFFENLVDIKRTNCYSNEGNIWKKSNIKFENKNKIIVLLREKFASERGRINCSLMEQNGKWRWLGIQYVIAEY